MVRVLVLGGGVCGVVFSKRLREKLGDKAEIVMVSRDEYHYMPAFFPDVAFGEAEPEETRAPLRPIAERLGVKLLVDTVTKVDLERQTVFLEKGEAQGYDYLAVCMGTRYGWDDYPGLRTAHHNYTLEGALELRKALAGFRGGEIALVVPEFPYRCPGYAFEMAAKLLVLARRKGVLDKTLVRIFMPIPLERALQRFFDVARTAMELHGLLGRVEYYFGAKLDRVEPEERKVYFKTGESFKYDLLIATPPPRPPKPLDDTPLVWSEDRRFLETSFPTFRSPKYDNVFVPTDGAMPSIHMVFAGIPTHYAAVAAADTIASEVSGIPAGEPAFPDSITFYLDYGATGAIVAFDVKPAPGGKASTKPYTALTHPLIKLVKKSFYRAWISSLKTGVEG